MSIEKKLFGKMPSGEDVYEFIIENVKGTTASIINYGATLIKFICADKNGSFKDILVGFDNIDDYIKLPGYYFGQTVGQYANRLNDGKFSVNGIEYNVDKNEGSVCLHGAGEYSQSIWKAIIADDNKVEFSYHSPDGKFGFPGNVDIKVIFTLDNNDSLSIEYFAESDKDTIVNFTNHAYFNLNSNFDEDVLNHELWLNCDYYTPTDIKSIPTGEIRSVEGTAFDFRTAKTIGRDIKTDDQQLIQCRGYDHNFCINNYDKKERQFAHVYEKNSGRTLDAYTDLPGVQLYTGNFMTEEDKGKNNISFKKHYGFCLETQFYPDSPNHENFPSCFLKAGEEFYSITRYKVGVDENS